MIEGTYPTLVRWLYNDQFNLRRGNPSQSRQATLKKEDERWVFVSFSGEPLWRCYVTEDQVKDIKKNSVTGEKQGTTIW